MNLHHAMMDRMRSIEKENRLYLELLVGLCKQSPSGTIELPQDIARSVSSIQSIRSRLVVDELRKVEVWRFEQHV